MAAITFVGAGTAVATDGGSAPVPTLPSGIQDGDVMVVIFYSRNTTTGTVQVTTTGWVQIVNEISSGGLLAAWYKVCAGNEVKPVFSLTNITGGVAGDQALAQVAAWRNVDFMGTTGVVNAPHTNGANQNIGVIDGIILPVRDVVIVIGGKSDDWTSVATLSGDGLTWNEIAEKFDTTGADAGIVWDYAINDTGYPVTVTGKTFTVTGGAAAVAKGVMFSMKNGDDSMILRRKRFIHRHRSDLFIPREVIGV